MIDVSVVWSVVLRAAALISGMCVCSMCIYVGLHHG